MRISTLRETLFSITASLLFVGGFCRGGQPQLAAPKMTFLDNGEPMWC
jgi:hypothetical protein